MSVVYNIKAPIPDANEVCELDLEMPTFSDAPCILPFGLAATESDTNPASAADIPEFVTVKPVVFKDALMSRDKAGAPDFIPLFKGQDELLTDEAIGYFYVFLNGYLWREVAALPVGALSEVDLRIHHDKDFRPHSTYHAFELTLPVKTKGLLTDNTDIEYNDVQIAFSRLQWSWAYINVLGGMWDKDPRFDMFAPKSKCRNTHQAASYRSARMQTLSMQNAPNWQSIEHMDSIIEPPLNTAMPYVYVNDIMGIAQSLKLDADKALIDLKLQQKALEQDGFYKSALLAYSLFRNDELWENEQYYFARAGRNLNRPKHRDAHSRHSRQVGYHLDPAKLEKYLLGDNPQDVVNTIDDYISARQTLLNLHTNANINWQAVLREFAMAPTLAYPFVFEHIYEQLLCLQIECRKPAVFLPALQDNRTQQALLSKLDELEQNSQEYIETLVNNPQSWLNIYFVPQDELYGPELSANKPDEGKILSDDGAFDPNKLIEASQRHFLAAPGIPDLFVYEQLNKKAEKGVVESLSFYERRFKQLVLEQINIPTTTLALFSRQVASLAKSFRTPGFEDIQIHDRNAIPNDRVALQVVYDTHPLIKKVTGKKGKRALKGALHAIANGRQPNTNQIATIANRLHKNINPDGAQALSTQKGHPYNAKHIQDEIMHMLVEVKDIQGTFKHIEQMGGKVFTIPQREVPTNILTNPEQDVIITQSRNISLSGLQKFNYEMKRGLTVPLLLFSGITAYKTYVEYEKNFGDKDIIYSGFKHVATIGGVLTGIGAVWEVYSKDKLMEQLTKERWEGLASKFHTRSNLAKFTYLRIFGGIVGGVTGGVQIADGFELLKKHDNDAAIITILAGTLGVGVSFYGAIYVYLGPIGWGLFIGSILLSILAQHLIDTRADKWCKHGPFAKQLLGVFANEQHAPFNQFENPEVYHSYIFASLYSPSVKTTKVNKHQYLVAVELPLFNQGESQLHLEFSYILNIDSSYSYIYGTDLNKATAVAGRFSEQGVVGVREYTLTKNDNGSYIANYVISLPTFDFGAIPYDIDTKAKATLIYNKDITLPIDLDALEKAIRPKAKETAN